MTWKNFWGLLKVHGGPIIESIVPAWSTLIDPDELSTSPRKSLKGHLRHEQSENTWVKYVNFYFT